MALRKVGRAAAAGGGCPHLRGEGGRNRLRVRPGRVLRPGLAQQAETLGCIAQRQVADAEAGVVRRRAEQRQVVADQHVHAGPIEEVGAVCEHAPHVLATRHDVEGQVEPAGHAAEAKRGAVRTVQGELFVGSVKELEGDLHERVVAEVPFRCERLDQRLEGQVLMGEGAERGLAHPVEQLAERQLRPATDSYREGVDEEADQGLGLGAGTVRGRHAHHHVVLAAVPRQQHLEGTEQRHEQGDALLPAERFQPCDQRCGQRELYGFAPMGLDGGTRIVCRQAQHQGRAIQCLLPKGDLLLLHRAGHPGPLPDGEVGVLDIQPWQCGGGAGDAFPVEAPEFVHQDVNRPAVGDDVVHGDHQCVILVRQSGCHHTHQRAVRQPERGARLCSHQVPHTPSVRSARSIRTISATRRAPGASGAETTW